MKLADKLATADDSLTIQRYDNGYVVEVCGRDSADEWVTAKILASTLELVQELIEEFSNLPQSR